MPREKGLFGSIRLPLTKKYLYPQGRNRLLMIGAVLGVLAAGVLAAGVFFHNGRLLSSGPLSSPHASLEGNCLSCHVRGGGVSDEKCALCHEKFTTGTALHGFDAHYIYVSGDRTRVSRRAGESACIACHTEHGGRQASLVDVGDRRCATCHDFTFASHPDFEFAARQLPDDSALKFTHVRHVQKVMEQQHLSDHEQACLSCHNVTSDGKLFQPIDFAKHCASCHLGSAEHLDLEPLEVRDSGRPIVTVQGGRAALDLGVETLESVRRRLGPGESWATAMSPARFDAGGGQVLAHDVEHADPWIMHNLRVLRSAIYPDEGLAALLRSSGDVPRGADRRVLYEEALATLRDYAQGLRGTTDGDVRQALEDVDGRLADAARRIESPDAALQDAAFRAITPRPELSDAQLDAIDAFAGRLAGACTKCHQIRRAAIVRVQQDQQALRRAKFDHDAHALQRECLSCHSRIPIADYLSTGSAPEAVDNAAIQNLPGIGECRTCHAPGRVSNQCITCHDFHPVKIHLMR